MTRGRWISGLGVVMAGLLAAVCVTQASAAAPRPHLCLVGCPTTTTTATAPPTTQTPVAGTVAVSAITPTSAHFSASLNTGNQTVNYSWETFGGGANELAGPSQAPAQPNPTTVAYTDEGLVPNSKYQVGLDVGQSFPTYTNFHTPLLPGLAIRFTARGNAILDTQAMHFRTTLLGASKLDSGDDVALQQLVNGHWADLQQYDSDEDDAVMPASHQAILSASPNRNTRIRAELLGTNFDETDYDSHPAPIRRVSYSRSLPVYVLPDLDSSLTRPNDGPDLQYRYAAYVHPLPVSYHGETVYFYAGAPNAKQLSLVGTKTLRYSSKYGSQLVAIFNYRDAEGAEMAACVKHALLPDMGVPFTDHGCGGSTLSLK